MLESDVEFVMRLVSRTPSPALTTSETTFAPFRRASFRETDGKTQ